jgi:hypothetical protein
MEKNYQKYICKLKYQIVHLSFWYLKWPKCLLSRETVRKTFTAQIADNIELYQNTGDIYETFSSRGKIVSMTTILFY